MRSDQQSLRHLMQQREVSSSYQKWIVKLLCYDFEVQYKPRTANKVADALSRKTVGEVALETLVSSFEVDWAQLQEEIERDKALQLIKQRLSNGEVVAGGFRISEGRLLYKNRVVIPKQSYVIPILLREYHDSVVGGHTGEVKTYLRIAVDWYWVGMKDQVKEYVQQCQVCQQNKSSQRLPAGLLQPLPVPSMVWEDLSLDFIEGLPLSGGFNTVLVVVDRFSKYAHFLGLRHPFDARTVATVFIQGVVRLHGFPGSIVSDRDRIFLSGFWKELFKLQGTELRRSTAYHPQTDGQTENVNKVLETYLRCFVGSNPKTWAKWLGWAEFSYNTAPHCSTKMSPFKVLYGRDPPHLLQVKSGQTPVNSVEEMLLDRDAIIADLQFNLTRAQQIMKLATDGKR